MMERKIEEINTLMASMEHRIHLFEEYIRSQKLEAEFKRFCEERRKQLEEEEKKQVKYPEKKKIPAV